MGEHGRKVRIGLDQMDLERALIGAADARKRAHVSCGKRIVALDERETVGVRRGAELGRSRARGVHEALPCTLEIACRHRAAIVEHTLAKVERKGACILRDVEALCRRPHKLACGVVEPHKRLEDL